MTTRKHVVRVTIVGDEYAIRSDSTPEHTQRVAEYVDQAIRTVLRGAPAVEPHKAAILAALQITDELFQAKEADSALAQSLRELGDLLRHRLPPAKRQAVE